MVKTLEVAPKIPHRLRKFRRANLPISECCKRRLIKTRYYTALLDRKRLAGVFLIFGRGGVRPLGELMRLFGKFGEWMQRADRSDSLPYSSNDRSSEIAFAAYFQLFEIYNGFTMFEATCEDDATPLHGTSYRQSENQWA